MRSFAAANFRLTVWRRMKLKRRRLPTGHGSILHEYEGSRWFHLVKAVDEAPELFDGPPQPG